MASPAPANDFSKDFSLDADIFGPVKITLAGSADENGAQAILLNNTFPAKSGGQHARRGASGLCSLTILYANLYS